MTTKRVVLQHLTGPLAGLSQILGVLQTSTAAPPAALDGFELTPGRVGGAALVRSLDHHLLYREVDATPRPQAEADSGGSSGL